MNKEYTPEEIKNRLSNIGAAIGTIALDYIAELEAQIENLEGVKLAQGSALETEYMINESLKEENAELKKQLSNDCDSEWYDGFNCSEKARLEQLAKAEEHIKTLISCLIDWVQEGDKDYCHIAEAEQFLKEE